MANAPDQRPVTLVHERQILALHQLLREGRGDSREHEELCDRMLDTWRELDPATRAFMDDLSGDLYMLQNAEVLEDDSTDPESLGAQLQVAWNLRDYGRVLSLLRKKDAPILHPRDKIAFIRGRCLIRLGYTEAGLAFLNYASELSPANGDYIYFVLNELVDMGRLDDAFDRAEAVVSSSGATARSLLAAADVLVTRAQKRPAEARDLYERVIIVLKRALGLPEPLNSVRVKAHAVLGYCYARLGQTELAIRANTDALDGNVARDLVLVARGLLLLSTDESAAVLDFQAAVDARTHIAWPYLYLAHLYLKREEYARCSDLCEMGLIYAHEPAERANLYEWLAIARAALGAPEASVEELFERALDAAPLTLRIRRNREAFRAATAVATRAANWEFGNDTSVEQAQSRVEPPRLTAA